jgi:antitoxin HicB
MLTLRYPAVIRREPGDGYLVRFPDLQGAVTSGDDLADALVEAVDCLAAALAVGIKYREDIPLPSEPKRGMRLIDVPFDLAPKVALYIAIRQAGISNSELARRMGVRETIVRRMLDPKHSMRLETLQKAFSALGKKLAVSLLDAA